MNRLWFGLACLMLVTACGSGEYEDPILRLSAQEAMTKAQELFEKKKFAQAREYFQHAFEVEPNSALGRDALLLVADSYFEHGGSQNYIKAEAKYRDFQNRFPTSKRSDYVQFRIATTLEKRIRPPDRDQSITRKALEAFEDVIRVFPTSEYAQLSQERIGEVRQTVAESEFLKGRFNQKLRLHQAAVSRWEDLLEDFPDYNQIDKVLFYLIDSYVALEDEEKAADTRQQLSEEHPDSEYTRQKSG